MEIERIEKILNQVFKKYGLYNEDPKNIRNRIESHFKSLNQQMELDKLSYEQIEIKMSEYSEGFISGYFAGKLQAMWRMNKE